MPHCLPNGEWCYRHAVRPDGPSELDRQIVVDFLAYEHAHRREVTVITDPELADWEGWGTPATRPHPGLFAKQCCSHAYALGCGGPLVCHGAPAAVAAEILRCGALLPATVLTGRSGQELASASTWGEPDDYFEHVMFANGSCTAPEAVAHSRQLGRDLVPNDLQPGYPPAVRFYFDWAVLAAHSRADFDGVHPVKVRGEVELDAGLVAVVVHNDHREKVTAARDPLGSRVLILDAGPCAPEGWAAQALAAAVAIRGSATVSRSTSWRSRREL